MAEQEPPTKEEPAINLQPMNDLDINQNGKVDIQDIKRIYQSKTFWVNFIAILAFIAQQKFGFVMDESIQVELLGVINIILRSVTSEPVRWTAQKKGVQNGTT